MKEVITEFVRDLAGRYRHEVSDQFMIAYFETKLTGREDVNKTYAIASFFFEGLLEHRCGITGNGHHVAQAFTEYVMKNRPIVVP